MKEECALRGRRSLRDLYTGFALVLPLVGMNNIDRDQRERRPKGYINHEVIAARAGHPADKPFTLKA
jgi:hypothetical protein